MFLDEITMKEFSENLNKTKTLIIPYGTVEEHGSHLPLGTDTIIPVEILKEVSKISNVFIAPPVHYGVCTSTRQHPGTISITPHTLRHLTMDILRDAYRKGLRNFILLSGHGGGLHVNALKEVSEILIDELDDIKIAVLCPYDMLRDRLREIAETDNDSHAGEIETSLIMALRPDLVKGRSEEEYPSFPKPLIVRDKLKYWPGGVWGNPDRASSQKGQKVMRIIVDEIVNLIRKVESHE
ncbi:MAG TPA: creatininase family protein [Nitrospirae bacterium]|nr:creatininase family protein [Nitrospirota bacterium]